MAQQEQSGAMVDGETILLGGESLVLPPLPLIKFKTIEPILGSDKGFSEEYLTAFNNAVFYSLRRNYPQITQDFIVENVDLVNFPKILSAFLSVNGLAAKSATTPGEPVAS